jgi:Uma2 family endonuclease
VAVDLPTPLHRFSLEEYHRLLESGAFDEDTRMELIDGLLVDLSVKSPAHENAIAWLNKLLVRSLDDRFEVRVSAALTTGTSEPEPDYAGAGVPDYWVVDLDAGRVVVHGTPRDGAYEHTEIVGTGGELVASRLELPPISVAELLAAAG